MCLNGPKSRPKSSKKSVAELANPISVRLPYFAKKNGQKFQSWYKYTPKRLAAANLAKNVLTERMLNKNAH